MIRATTSHECSPEEIALNAKRIALADAQVTLAASATAVTDVEGAANLAAAQAAVAGLGATISATQTRISDAQAV